MTNGSMTFGLYTKDARKMKSYDVLYTRTKSSIVSGIKIRATSLDNLRRNIICNQKMFDWTYGDIEVFKGDTQIDPKTGWTSGDNSGFIGKIRFNRQAGLILWTDDPFGFGIYTENPPKIVDPKTGKLKGRL